MKQSNEQVASMVNERLVNFIYVGNYTGSDGTADIQCKVCGSVLTKSWVTIRHGKAQCDVCRHREAEARQKERKEKQKADALARAEQKKTHRKLNKEYKQIEFKQCPVCRKLFIPKTKLQYTCGSSCSVVLANTHKKDKRLLKIKGVTIDKGITLEVLFEKDAGTCCICGEACDWSDFYVNKNGQKICGNYYPSIDHIVPLAKGGKHSWANVQLAHRICNSLKSDTV